MKESEVDMGMFALCCGKVPNIISMIPFEAQCPICGFNAGVWGQDVSFLIHHWNRQLGASRRTESSEESPPVKPQELELNGFPGYTFCALETELVGWGRTDQLRRLDACVFKTPMDLDKHMVSKDGYKCYIDENRFLYPIDIIRKGSDKVLHLDWGPKKSRRIGSYVYANISQCSDRAMWYTLKVSANLVRDHKLILEWFRD